MSQASMWKLQNTRNIRCPTVCKITQIIIIVNNFEQKQMQQKLQLGNYTKLCGMRKDGQPFLVIPPNRFLCLLCLLVVNAVSAVILVLLSHSKQAYVFYTVHLVILIFLDVAWIVTAVSNPGLVLKSNYQQYNCQNCKQNTDTKDFLSIREHCTRCSICIEDREHHCSITGGCIGKGNKIVYHFFLLAVVLYFIDFLCTAPYIYYLG